jgi:hypothetical protein
MASSLNPIKTFWQLLKLHKWSLSLGLGAALGGIGDTIC